MRGFGLYPIFKRGFLKVENGLVVAVGDGWGGGGGGGGGLGGARKNKTSGGTLTFVALILWHILVSSEKNSPHTRRDKQTECNGSQSG